MLAIVVSRHGGPEVLEASQLPTPVPGPGELLVDVAAAGVNFKDIYEREGRPPYRHDPPFVPGSEGAGTVAATGPGVRRFAAGDWVAWALAPASYAGQVIVRAEGAVGVPAGTGLEVAAAAMLQGLTAHYLCNSTFPVTAGDTVVVHAAAGGVGLLLTQLVKRRGGIVLATTSSAAKADLARGAGADRVASYEDFAEVAREMTGGAGAAAVFDGVGAQTFEASLSALAPRGYLVLYGAASGPVPPFDLARLASAGSLFVTRPVLGAYLANRQELDWRAGELFDLIGSGQLEVRIGGRYPLAEAARAQEDLGSRRSTGKLLLLPG